MRPRPPASLGSGVLGWGIGPGSLVSGGPGCGAGQVKACFKAAAAQGQSRSRWSFNCGCRRSAGLRHAAGRESSPARTGPNSPANQTLGPGDQFGHGQREFRPTGLTANPTSGGSCSPVAVSPHPSVRVNRARGLLADDQPGAVRRGGHLNHVGDLAHSKADLSTGIALAMRAVLDELRPPPWVEPTPGELPAFRGNA